MYDVHPQSSAGYTMPTSKTQPDLPQEIFDDIIDHFHTDIQSLQTCALVSPSWLSSARVHLFYRVELHPPNKRAVGGPASFFVRSHDSSQCQKLYITVASSRDGRFGSIASYIRELHLCEGMLARQWFAHEPTLPLLICALVNLRRFEISRSASVRIPWNNLPLSLRGAVQAQVLDSSTLQELTLSSLLLENLGDLKRMLSDCRQLRVLEVNHLFFADESVTYLEDGGKRELAPLDTLVIGPRTSAALISYLLHPLSTVTVSTVRNLTLSISGGFPEFAKLLHASVSVENLELVLMNDLNLNEYWSIPPSQQFDLVQVANLRKLKVNIDVLQRGDDPLPWLSTLLQTGVDSMHSTRSNAIERIWVVYSLYLPAPYMDRSINTAIFDAWSEVDAILSGTGSGTDFEVAYAYENLKDVKLEFMLENPIGFGVAPRFLKDVVLDSPGLEKRDMLQIIAYDTSK